MTGAAAKSKGFAARPLWVDVTLLALSAVILFTLIALGNWQMRRLAWKLDLIETVEERAFGAPVAAPAGSPAPEYQRVYIQGTWQHDRSLRIKAVTALGPGIWLMTPIEAADLTLWINRGFVPAGLPEAEITLPTESQIITGLARTPRPGGTVLERNNADEGRWVSADLVLMNATQQIAATETYYVDADHSGPSEAWPRGGLTQVDFRNTHLSYALTWYAMACLFFGAMVYVVRERLCATS